MSVVAHTLSRLHANGEDFEWYPTTDAMIRAVARSISPRADSVMDIGAGDGRVLEQLAARCEMRPKLYAIEKAATFINSWPESIVPVGMDFYEQNLACLEVEYIFSNPPYSQFEAWAAAIIENGFAKKAFLVIPQRWKESIAIVAALKKRGASAWVIHNDDFHNAERKARAVVDVVEISYPMTDRGYHDKVQDPFDIWFNQNISTFDEVKPTEEESAGDDLAKLRGLNTIGEMVEAYQEEFGRMEANYRAIFKLDLCLLRELGIKKEAVREGIKAKMIGLKSKYWQILFDRLDVITSRLCTKTKDHFLEKIRGRAIIEFTANNAYAVVLWAIKNANHYYDEQLIELFRDFTNKENVFNYKSNQRAWKDGKWRYHNEEQSHYALDYRIVVPMFNAIKRHDSYGFDSYGGLAKGCHELLDDIVAVLTNLGYAPWIRQDSRRMTWIAGQWVEWADEKGTLFQVKAYLNGNLHFQFRPEIIMRLNIEAGRLLGWLKSSGDAVIELGYTPQDAAAHFGASFMIAPSHLKILAAHNPTKSVEML